MKPNNYAKLTAHGKSEFVFFCDEDRTERERVLALIRKFQAAHPHDRRADGTVLQRRHYVTLERPCEPPLERVRALHDDRPEEFRPRHLQDVE